MLQFVPSSSPWTPCLVLLASFNFPKLHEQMKNKTQNSRFLDNYAKLESLFQHRAEFQMIKGGHRPSCQQSKHARFFSIQENYKLKICTWNRNLLPNFPTKRNNLSQEPLHPKTKNVSQPYVVVQVPQAAAVAPCKGWGGRRRGYVDTKGRFLRMRNLTLLGKGADWNMCSRILASNTVYSSIISATIATSIIFLSLISLFSVHLTTPKLELSKPKSPFLSQNTRSVIRRF